MAACLLHADCVMVVLYHQQAALHLPAQRYAISVPLPVSKACLCVGQCAVHCQHAGSSCHKVCALGTARTVQGASFNFL